MLWVFNLTGFSEKIHLTDDVTVSWVQYLCDKDPHWCCFSELISDLIHLRHLLSPVLSLSLYRAHTHPHSCSLTHSLILGFSFCISLRRAQILDHFFLLLTHTHPHTFINARKYLHAHTCIYAYTRTHVYLRIHTHSHSMRARQKHNYSQIPLTSHRLLFFIEY